MIRIILFIAILCFMGACSGKQLSEAERANANVNGSNVNGLIMLQNVDPNAVNMTSNSPVNAPKFREEVSLPADPNVKPQLMEVPRGYNSTMVTTMDKQGKFVETRTFKNDPQVLKVVRMQENKTIKLHLKNGKVVDLPYDKAFDLFVDGAPYDMTALAGIKPPPAPVGANPAKKQ